MVGFLDDNPRVRRRRILGITVVGSTDEVERAIAHARRKSSSRSPTPRPSGSAVVRASEAAGIPCRIVRRRTSSRPRAGRGLALVSSTQADAGQARLDLFARFQAATPLLIVYFALAALYAWQASRHPVPTIFTDELELTQLSRAIARRARRHGAGSRMGLQRSSRTSSPRLVARLDLDRVRRREAAPRPRDDRDGLPRLRARPPRRLTLVRAGRGRGRDSGSGARVLDDHRRGAARLPDVDADALADRAVARRPEVDAGRGRRPRLRGRGPHAHAARDSLRGARARPLARLGVGAGAGGRSGRPGTGPGPRRSSWASRSPSALRPLLDELAEHDRLCKDRIFDHGVWAMGALAIGIGIVPMVVGIAALAARRASLDPQTRLRRHERRRDRRLHRLRRDQGRLHLHGLRDARRRAERHLPRPCPVRGRGAGRGAWRRAQLGDRRGDRLHALRRRVDAPPPRELPVLRGARALDRRLREPGARVAGEPDRERPARRLRGLALAFVVALRFVRRGSGAYRVLAGTAAVSSSPGRSPHRSTPPRASATSTRVARNLPSPYDWVEEDGRLGRRRRPAGRRSHQRLATEFFNPSIRKMWSLDGTAPGRGRSSRPTSWRPTGRSRRHRGRSTRSGSTASSCRRRVVARRGTRGSTGSAISR